MNRTAHLVTAVGLILIGGTGAVLNWLRTHHRLSAAGVRIVTEKLTSSAGTIETNYISLPENIPGWVSRPLAIQQIELDTLPKDTTFGRRHYTNSSQAVQVNVVLMGTDRTSIHRPEFCLTGQGWGIEKRSKGEILINRPTPYSLPIQRFDCSFNVAEAGSERVMKGIYVFWFVTDGLLTADHRQRMWWMAGDLLRRGTLQRWAYVSYFSACNPGDEEQTYEGMTRLIADSVPEFQTVSGSAR